MDFGLNEDQALVAQTMERWASDHMEIPADKRSAPYLPGDELAEELAGQGYYDVAEQSELGALGAVLLIEQVARTPWAIEIGASALLAPMLKLSGLPRPLAVMRAAAPPSARFLAVNGAALVDAGDHVRLLRCGNGVTPLPSRYAYPLGRYDGDVLAASERLDKVSIQDFRGWRQVAVTAEAVAAMRAALDLTVDYVKTRVQFGRPIGSFQAVQHRLAECSSMLHSARLLLYRAAAHGIEFSEPAAIVTHDAVKRILYETTQFHGAIGLTLEYPLHLWSYRLRLLQFELAEGLA